MPTQAIIIVAIVTSVAVAIFLCARAVGSMLNKSVAKSQADIRGVSDDNLKFLHTQNLLLLAIARSMEAQGVDDKPLIDELYKRARAGIPKPQPAPTTYGKMD